MSEIDFYSMLKRSWHEYGKNFPIILKIYLLFYAAPSIIFFSAALSQNLKSNADVFLLIFPLVYILYIVSLIFNSVTLYYIVLYNEKGRITFKQAVNGGAKYFWRFLGLGIVRGFALIGLFLLFIIPGIIFSVYWNFAPYALVGEKKGIIESMKKSKSAVKGKWWQVFGYSILFYLLASVISFVAFLIGFILGAVALFLFFGSSFMQILLIFNFIYVTMTILINLAILPFSMLFYKNFYLELKK